MIITMNITSQLDRLWLTFHQMIVNSIAQMNTTMSRQLPVGHAPFGSPGCSPSPDQVADAPVDAGLQPGFQFGLIIGNPLEQVHVLGDHAANVWPLDAPAATPSNAPPAIGAAPKASSAIPGIVSSVILAVDCTLQGIRDRWGAISPVRELSATSPAVPLRCAGP